MVIRNKIYPYHLQTVVWVCHPSGTPQIYILSPTEKNYQTITKYLTSTFQIAKFMSYKGTQRAVIEVTDMALNAVWDPGLDPGTQAGKCK